ncbi:hypothetical protein ANANG_G00049580 [Anguilla anguilla]|uniref:Uncharacterized protein n=1 Tax=Anguilla anguilla TaxID=7936 RepID=A0A9D3MV46_ANGAN|nr:hypothetical protein ANANG_G00049580 [Anguilla anguilla]
MYQCAEICFPRKKRVPESFHSNTYRIFDENAPERLDSFKVYKDHIFPSRSAEEINLYKTHNNPQPHNVKFIRTNVRWLNAPISHMETKSTEADQSHWWPNGCDQGVTPKAPYSRDSIQRRDFRAPRTAPHAAPGGAVTPTPQQPLPLKVLQESMSFIHQYNSRRLKDQPYQGKRHGAFVWREVPPPNRWSRPGGPTGGGAFLRSEPSHSPGRGGNAMTSPQLGPHPAPRLPWDSDGALPANVTPPQTSPSQRFRTGGPLSEGPSAKHVSSDWASGAAAPKQRDRVRSLDTCPAALPTLRHGGRNSLP